jgi:hypothetical protein
MKENSVILMKMPMANELLTTSGKAMRTAVPIVSKRKPRVRTRVIIALSPAEAGRLEGERQKKHGEHHDQSGIRADILNPQGFGDPHHQAGDKRADHISQGPQHHGDESHQHKDLPDKRIGRIEWHQQRSGGARERQRDAERNAEYPIGVDAHQHRHITVLRRGAHRLAKIGGAQEDPECAAQRHRHDKGDELCHRDIKPADTKCFIRIRSMDRAVVSGEQH